jgi:hypothetical protein
MFALPAFSEKVHSKIYMMKFALHATSGFDFSATTILSREICARNLGAYSTGLAQLRKT